MSDTPRAPQQQPDEEPRAQSEQASQSVAPGTQASSTPATEPEVLPLSVVEEYYKRPGRTMLASVFGFEPFDFWFGRFYVGFFGILVMLGTILGVAFYFYEMLVVEGTYNILAARIDPPPISEGLRLVTPGEPGGSWLVIIIAATIAFVGWALRQVDISRKLELGYEVPLAFGAVVSSWITLQWLRPIAMGAWGNGFPLGITHHLDWVSNIGYQYYNFFYNPFHALGITLLFASTLFLAMHGSAILSAARRPVTDRHVDTFWRQLFGYSVGEIGIHRVAFWAGATSVLVSNLCIFLSGTLVQDWNAFYTFWDGMPIWSFSAAGLALFGLGLVFARRKQEEIVDPDEIEDPDARGLYGNIGRPFNLPPILQRFVGKDGIRVFPTHLGIWGIISIVTGSVCAIIILLDYLLQVGYNPILFVREFFNLALMPPAKEYGLSLPPWNDGGSYLVATFFLHISVLAWWMRIYTRARATGLGTHLAWGFAAALSLYFVIYLIRPIAMGRWSESAGHG
ncbi:MAG: bifunctional photosynthetic reaction center subunit L/M, partial [Chloroflexota bacterium]